MDEKSILKQLAEQKLKAFAVGNMGKRAMTKKELEEQRKKEEDEAAAQAFQEFVNTFQETPGSSASKVWIKAGTYDAGARKEDTKEKGKLYKPESKLPGIKERSSFEKVQEIAKLLPTDLKPERLGKKKEKEKKKTNLELFKEELRQRQEEREERHKYKDLVKVPFEPDLDMMFKNDCGGSFDNGDPNTTNLYLGNLNPKITEGQLTEIFGKFGPLASIKIMWPRSDEEKARGRNCGFVAFMSRKDGERALKNLSGKDIMNYEMKLGWGKSVPIPPFPIYIPHALLELSMPPPPSGLPFNAQPIDPDTLKDLDKNDKDYLSKMLIQSIVKVIIPTDRTILALIHRVIEFVIREGPLFEAFIMNRELNNPLFRFLFDNQSALHIYYRWKLFSMMQGDTQKEWSTREFRMFKGGSIWKPPVMNIYTQGMPDELVVDDDTKGPTKGTLSDAQRDRLEELLRYITPQRIKVGEAMVFCIEHSEAADEICDCIGESLSNPGTAMEKKIARFYLISDILHNCGVKMSNASYYRKAFEQRILNVMENIHLTYKNIESRLKAEGFKSRVLFVLRAWEQWLIYPREFLRRLEDAFLGIERSYENENSKSNDNIKTEDANEDSDGVPLEDDGDDATPFDGAALLKGAIKHNRVAVTNNGDDSDDVDGMPIGVVNDAEDIDGMPLTPPPPSMQGENANAGFISSKWETVDPEQVQAQAMTTSKWDQLETMQSRESDDSDSNSSEPSRGNDATDEKMNEERRQKLREVEVKVMQYQDELEAGQRTLKSGWTVGQQVTHYRRKLVKKMDKKFQTESVKEKAKLADKSASDGKYSGRRVQESERSERRGSKRSRSSTPDVVYYKDTSRSSRKSKRSRSSSGSSSPSKSRYKSPSRSPRRTSSRRSRSPDPPSPPSPPKIKSRSKYASPRVGSRDSVSPLPSESKYRLITPSPPRSSSKHTRNLSPISPPRSSKVRRKGDTSLSPIRSPASHGRSRYSKYSRSPSPTPSRTRHLSDRSRSPTSYRGHSPTGSTSSRKHKHRY